MVILNPEPEETVGLAEQIEQLRAEVKTLRTELKEAKIWTLSTRLDDLWEWVEDLDQNQKTISKGAQAQPKQRNQAALLKILLTKEGTMMAKDARNRLGLKQDQFSRLLDVMKKEIEVKPFHQDRRKNVLKLKNKK